MRSFRELRGKAGPLLKTLGLGGQWVRAEANGTNAQPLDRFRLFAILGTWMEADVVEATVLNAFRQGCERVYLIDNESTDDTVKLAVGAGAILSRSYATEQYDERLRLSLFGEVIEEVSAREDVDHIWWLLLDADEFHHGPLGLTIREYLAGLDRRFRIVGARVFNHVPDRSPPNVPGFHPLDYQPLCEEFNVPKCRLRHWKHPLQRWDRQGPVIVSSGGFHEARCATKPLLEPTTAVFLHHFQYREKEVTYRRLEDLCTASDREVARNKMFDERQPRTSGMTRRFQTLDHVYAQRWEQVDNLRPLGAKRGIRPRPWAEQISLEDQHVARWYGHGEEDPRQKSLGESAR